MDTARTAAVLDVEKWLIRALLLLLLRKRVELLLLRGARFLRDNPTCFRTPIPMKRKGMSTMFLARAEMR
jgi:hypothetical protein